MNSRGRYTLILLAIGIMFIGLLFSRAFLSIGMILFFLLSWLNTEHLNTSIKRNLGLFVINKYYFLLCLLFFIPLITGFWSNDLVEWEHRTIVKLPLLIIPLAFVAMPQLKRNSYKMLNWFFVLLITIGTLWSFTKYLSDMGPIHASYLRASVMMVPFDNDHVRFSWAVVIAILLMTKLLLSRMIISRQEKILAFLVIGWLVIYLHILAAKTGLITLYLCFFIWLFHVIVTKKNKSGAIVCLFIPILLLILAYYFLPTFHNRVHYIAWDYQQYNKGNFPPGLPDGARILSWKGGLQIFCEYLYRGVGFGDIKSHMQAWYNAHYNYLPLHDRLLPSSEFLIYGCGAGLTGILFFLATVLTPFFINKEARDIYTICFHFAGIFCFLTDVNLEGQYGVFLYCFFAGWFPIHPVNKELKTLQ